MMFEDFIREGLVRRVSRDRQLAKSLARIAKLRMKNLESIPLTNENSFSFIEDCYEAIREMADALMALRGFKSYSHEASVEFLKKFYSFKLTFTNVNKINRYRRIRNDIKYRGLLTTKREAKEVLKNTKKIIAILLEIIQKEGDIKI